MQRMKNRLIHSEMVGPLFALLFLLYIPAAGFSVRSTVPGQLVELEGDWPYGVYLIVLACAVALFLDIVVVRLARLDIPLLRLNRDTLYLVGAMSSVIPSWYLVQTIGLSLPAALLYLGSPLIIFYMALVDIREKYKHGVYTSEAG